jgi:hypothetical protein
MSRSSRNSGLSNKEKRVHFIHGLREFVKRDGLFYRRSSGKNQILGTF